MTPISLLLIAALSAWAGPKAEVKSVAQKSFVDASFELPVPAGWAMEAKPDGASLIGPGAEGLPARVVVRYVKPDHALYGTPQAYMARLNKPSSVPLKGWRNGPVESSSAAGRKSLRMERDTFDYAAADSVSPKEVAMREEHVAVPAARGFYLLVYSAPRSVDSSQRRAFRAALAGFKPKL